MTARGFRGGASASRAPHSGCITRPGSVHAGPRRCLATETGSGNCWVRGGMCRLTLPARALRRKHWMCKVRSNYCVCPGRGALPHSYSVTFHRTLSFSVLKPVLPWNLTQSAALCFSCRAPCAWPRGIALRLCCLPVAGAGGWGARREASLQAMRGRKRGVRAITQEVVLARPLRPCLGSDAHSVPSGQGPSSQAPFPHL